MQEMRTHSASSNDLMMTSMYASQELTKLRLVLAFTLSISHVLLKSHLLGT